ncbi:MAG: mannonate dehydratase [Flavobacteriaceae bacterium]|nr:mannonate dehydratase [Flavobacteriaceae bacterium]
MKDNRRSFIKKSTALAAGTSLIGLTAACKEISEKDEKVAQKEDEKIEREWPIKENNGRPKICVGTSRNSDRDTMRKIKQIGVDYVLMGGPPIPWTVESLREIMDAFKEEGLTVINMMIGGHPNTIYGREGRDDEIEKIKQSLIAAGEADLPVVEYNFYAHRLMEGYYEKLGRGGAGHTAFDYEPVKDLPADAERGEHRAEDLWKNLTYFLNEVIPVAEKAGVRMALHPNDPPIPVSHGSDQIMATLEDWKRLIELVDSPSNGITFDCGVTRELGEDPLEVLQYFGSRDRINHMHYRNVISDKPYVKYSEVFLDEGQVNMYAVMRDIIGLGYTHGIYPEHPRALDYDKEHPEGIRNQYPGGGGYTGMTYNIGFTRAMELAVLSSK